jgi:hypothetical protein
MLSPVEALVGNGLYAHTSTGLSMTPLAQTKNNLL